ncbi:hypothetical protein [Limobrevibacterium gyesilva]|uniref:Uncharacterized protein n=1 Tax=Limobrevibacterium gyesilva TaxID=2991712 RepID=A0AA42CHV6_9PROT|nr:hypothetical protein [Limobrevibacterium gyesilva]MCW3477661.1 hypothetical protein [Limobrevibacterium gyesilva]
MSEDTTDPAALEERAVALERRLAEIEATTNARLVRAELKAEAVRAGMVDLDGLKLVDTAGVTLNAQGEVEGAAGLMRELRRAKPWLFGGASSSSSASAPPAQPPRPKRATEMSFEEWQAARAEMLRRR